MELAAGLVILYNHKILLCHPTKAKWYGTYSIPKGLLQNGENLIECAIRETKEETGIEIDKYNIENSNNPIEIAYWKGKNIYKEVHCFVVKVENLQDIGLKDEKVPKECLQKDEVDWAGFIGMPEAEKRILKRQNDLLYLLGIKL